MFPPLKKRIYNLRISNSKMLDQHNPKTLIKSRAVLQSLKGGREFQKYQLYDHLLERIWRDVHREASSGKTKHVFMLPAHEVINTNFASGEFVEILKNEYIDCVINYIETSGVSGNIIERALTIDWS